MYKWDWEAARLDTLTLMHDPVYRLGIAWQNVAYNQPPHTGLHLGAAMETPESAGSPVPTIAR